MICLATLIALPLVAEPQVSWRAPDNYFEGSPFVVQLEISAPEEDTELDGWLLYPGAFLADGKKLAERDKGRGTIQLPKGAKISVEVDLGPYLEVGRDFELTHTRDPRDGSAAPHPVRVWQTAPEGLDFMQVPAEELPQYHVILRTVRGDLVFALWPDVAPMHVRNFLDLCHTGFYEGTQFHRVVPGFMIQGGDPNTRDKHPAQWGTGNGPRKLKAEFNERKHERGVLSMARGPEPDSASCQFFVVHRDSRHLDRQYSAFGRLLTGFEALDLICNTQGTPIRGGGGTQPSMPQFIQQTIVVVSPGP